MLTQFSQPGSPVSSTQVPQEGGTERTVLFKSEEEAIGKRDENQSVLDIKEQVELLQNLLDVVKVSGDEGELNKCMNQIMNLKDKYSELMGRLNIHECPQQINDR